MNESALALVKRLSEESIVSLERDAWEAVAGQFEEIERHATFIGGDLIIIQLDSGFAAVEQPESEKRVIRRLPDSDAVRRFVDQRRQEYDRMWDGCGCKINYYS